MSDCRVPMPNYQPVEQATIRRMCRQFGEPPWTYQLDKPECWPDEAVQFVDAVELAGVRFERVRECAPEFDGKWFRCGSCGERLDRFGVRTTYRGGETVREIAEPPRHCPGCGSKLKGVCCA